MKKPSLRKFGTVVFLLGRLSVAVRRTLEFHRRNSMNCARLGGLARPKFSTAASCLRLRRLTNSSMRFPTKTMRRPKTGRRLYERVSLFHASQTAAWLCRRP